MTKPARPSLTAALAALSALGALSWPPAHAGQGWTVVEQLLKSFHSSGHGPLSSKSRSNSSYGQGESGDKELSVKASSFIDYSEMACRCLGKHDWEALSGGQKKEFVSTLRTLVETRYYPRWRKIFGSGKVTFQDEVTQGGDTVVHTRLSIGKKEEVLAWRMAEVSGTPRVVSLAVDDKDLLDRLKKRIQARQQKAGFDGLLAWMKGKTGSSDISGNTPIAAVHAPASTIPPGSGISD